MSVTPPRFICRRQRQCSSMDGHGVMSGGHWPSVSRPKRFVHFQWFTFRALPCSGHRSAAAVQRLMVSQGAKARKQCLRRKPGQQAASNAPPSRGRVHNDVVDRCGKCRIAAGARKAHEAQLRRRCRVCCVSCGGANHCSKAEVYEPGILSRTAPVLAAEESSIMIRHSSCLLQ